MNYKEDIGQYQKKEPVGVFLPLTAEYVENQETAVKNESVYGSDDKELKQFLQQHPLSVKRDVVISKILLIDFTNSTNLRMYRRKGLSIFMLADHILSIPDLDDSIKSGKLDVVEKIANTGKINLFSFASKYCCYHNSMIYGRDDYSIYDTLVANIIPQYLTIPRSIIEKCRVNNDFHTYQMIIDRLISVHGLDHIDKIRRKVDHFLWFSSKEKNEIDKRQEEGK